MILVYFGAAWLLLGIAGHCIGMGYICSRYGGPFWRDSIILQVFGGPLNLIAATLMVIISEDPYA